jgi:exodeoxyribonuclease-3
VPAHIGAVRVIVYVPAARASVRTSITTNWAGCARCARAALEIAAHPQLVVGINIAPEDRDVHDPAAWAGSVQVSAEEREALRDTLALGLSDLFRRFEQPPQSFSWWDYRAGAFRRNHGLRIDLVLASTALAERCTACRIDREPRRVERASDHTPVIATLIFR